MRQSVLWGFVAAAVAVAGVWWGAGTWQTPRAVDLAVPTAENKLLAAVSAPAPAKAAVTTDAAAEPAFQTPQEYDNQLSAPSLADTGISGRLAADADGDLILSPDVKDFFDYFLNTVGEVTPEQAAGEIRRLAEAHLPPKAVDQAIRLLARYVVYKAAALQLMRGPMVPQEPQNYEDYLNSLEQAFNKLMRVRRQHLDAEVVQAFFGLEEQYSQYTFDYLRIQADPRLSEAQKASLIALQRQTLPAAIRKSEEQAELESRQAAEVYAAIEQAVDELEVRTLLAKYAYSSAQIEDVVQAYREQKAFNRNYQRYLEEKRQLEAQGGTETERNVRAREIRERLFPTEQERLMAQLRDMNEAMEMQGAQAP